MASQIAGLFVSIGADSSQFRKEMARLQQDIRRGLGAEAMSVSKAASAAIAGVGAAIAAVSAIAVKSAGQMEQYRVAFTTMLGSADAAKEKLKEMRDFAAATPFRLDDVIQGTKRLMAMGFAAKDTQTVLAAVGDASSALGMGSEGINRITLALGQMNAKGKVSAEEMKQLTETGVNAWKYLADSLGVSQKEAMDMAQKGSVRAGEAIKALLSGMNQDFGGMMGEQSKTILGIFSSIEDNLDAVLVSVGENIVDAFGLKTAAASFNQTLSEFADAVQSSGISEALKAVVPPELMAGIFAVSGAIAAVAIPSLTALASAALAALVPLLPLIAAGAAAGLALYAAWKYGVNFSGMLDELKAAASSLLARMQPVFEQIRSAALRMGQVVATVLKAWSPAIMLAVAAACVLWEAVKTAFEGIAVIIGGIVNTVATVVDAAAYLFLQGVDRITGAFGFILGYMPDWVKGMLARIKDFCAPAIELMDKVAGALNNLFGGGSSSAPDSGASAAPQSKQPGKEETADRIKNIQLGSPPSSADTAKKSGGKGKKEDNPELKALDALKEQRNMLDKQADLRNEINNALAEAQAENLKGSEAGLQYITDGLQSRLVSIQSAVQSASDAMLDAEMDYKKAQIEGDAEEISRKKAHYEELAKIAGEAEDAAGSARLEALSGYIGQMAEYEYSGQALRDDLQAAANERDLAGYMELLDAKNAACLAQIEGEQEVMDTYYQLQMEAHRSFASYLAETAQTLYSNLSTALSDVIAGAKSASEAFKSLGQAMLKMLADFVAKRLAATLAGQLLASQANTLQVAAAKATGAAVAAAWAKAAAMVSLATMGSNAAAAAAGMTATTALAMSLAAPVGLAKGGIATGPTIAMIGEGRYDETVLPLSQRILAPIFAEAMGQSRENNVVTASLNLYGDINNTADLEDMYQDFSKLLLSDLRG